MQKGSASKTVWETLFLAIVNEQRFPALYSGCPGSNIIILTEVLCGFSDTFIIMPE